MPSMRDVDSLSDDERFIMEHGWPCACVKRERGGRMSHIKLHHPDIRECKKCGCTKDDSERAGRKR